MCSVCGHFGDVIQLICERLHSALGCVLWRPKLHSGFSICIVIHKGMLASSKPIHFALSKLQDPISQQHVPVVHLEAKEVDYRPNEQDELHHINKQLVSSNTNTESTQSQEASTRANGQPPHLLLFVNLIVQMCVDDVHFQPRNDANTTHKSTGEVIV